MKRVWSFLWNKQASVRSAATVLIIMVFASRVLGLLRDRMLAARFSPDELGVYLAAFRLPNFLFELLVMGALTSAFIPVYTKYLTLGKQEEAWKISNTIITISCILLAFITIPILIWTKEVSHFIAPGFTDIQVEQMIGFTRFMVIAQVFPLLIGNFFTGILQSHNLFTVPGVAPVVYNVGIIISIIVFSSTMGLWAPVVGVGIGAVLFMCIQIPSLVQLGYRNRMALDIHNQGVREIGKLMVPRTIGLAISQIDTTVDLILSTLLGARMVTVFNFAQHLQQLPIGLFGATVAQAAFPLLAQASANEDKEKFTKTLYSALNQIVFFIMPVSVLFIVLRIPIVRLVFGASRFDWQATVLTGMTLSMFAISLSAQAVSQLLTRGFYALYDTKTPVIIGVITILINTMCSVIFVQLYKFPVWSLGLSTSIASIINAALLVLYLGKRIGVGTMANMFYTPMKIIIASLLTGIALYIPLKLFDQLVFDTTRTFGLLLLTGVASAIGLVVYIFLVWVLDVREVKTFISMISQIRKPKQIILESASEVVGNGGQNTPIS
ncbi:MAG: putative peptidoglycan lipid II flippase MurJ [Microgenomates group bacterium GW2011_GWC1_39_12]|nr:MAG: putative peptidoglycan lipid II flippase MurJ [Microgenomates group bacterium GW2011_GWC1_39_12]